MKKITMGKTDHKVLGLLQGPFSQPRYDKLSNRFLPNSVSFFPIKGKAQKSFLSSAQTINIYETVRRICSIASLPNNSSKTNG